MLSRIARASEKRPIMVIVGVGLFTIPMIYGVLQISMSSEMEKFAPEGCTSIQVTGMVENEIGGVAREVVLIEGENLTSANSFRTISDFQSSLKRAFENYMVQIRSYPHFLIPSLENQDENWENLSDSRLEAQIKNLLSMDVIKEQTDAYFTENRDATLIVVVVDSRLPESGQD
ncbi:hypothetical protein AKJ43_02755 [candidate division MSBL1 archaeon SCGC-AAA261D19]|uniref:Membrane transport protein MMPL domain-containing protein n=1 Tax=candidate division MSBL1 archaeon SCGC-AAA261D19 TaxID=1698273 RepID=A0A133V696_9EURY|nr:hypothetical protein AKJ43_02755 [candidate division MSBL1 archaeon SCGC-AAA261D19]